MRRTAFTLIELLVVMALMVVLATLVIAFFPSAATSARESRAGSNLQGWLNIAKQRALRDQAPRGLRLWIAQAAPNNQIGPITFDPVANPIAIECQYIEQPDDYSGPRIASGINTAEIVFDPGTDLYNGYSNALTDEKYWTVQRGDRLEVLGTGLVHIVTAVPNMMTINISPPLAYPIPTGARTSNYRIIRRPRVVGDETLKLPHGTMIDLKVSGNVPYVFELNSATPPMPVPVAVDILFAPSGEVISPGLAADKIHLWVRAPSNDAATDTPYRGDPTLISIFVRTGFVGAYQPAQSGNPYALVN